MPLQYEFVYRAVLWYIKIARGETDQLLTDQLESFSGTDSTFSMTCFYQHCGNYVKQLSNVGGVNLLDVGLRQRKEEVKRAIFMELDEYWKGLSEARLTREIHPRWEERKLPAIMGRRYTHTVMHRMALGRGPLRAVIHRRREAKLQRCRYGCEAKEDAFHVVMSCKKTKGRRQVIKKICLKMKLEFSMKTVFNELQLQDEVESLIGVFLNV